MFQYIFQRWKLFPQTSFFLFVCFFGEVFAFFPIWTQGLLNRQDCCWASILLGAPLWLWGRVCLCCGAWPQLQAGHLVPQGELLGKTLIQVFARQWKICNSWESLMEINNFLIILCLRIDLLSSCVLSYLHLKQSYVSLLWYCECFKIFRTNTHERSKSSSNSTNSMLFFQLEFLLIQLERKN